mmetsp:Transcript_27875/g.64337  ORF Transcript_27875/g.64337 Transcript_27875/m.64337 type:complete len:337 (+) Transcript_27875:46-1056(+)
MGLADSPPHPCDAQYITTLAIAHQVRQLRKASQLALVGTTFTIAACRWWKWLCSQKELASVSNSSLRSTLPISGAPCPSPYVGDSRERAPLYKKLEVPCARLTITEAFEVGCDVVVHILHFFELEELEPLRRGSRKLTEQLRPRVLLPKLARLPADHWIAHAPLAETLTTTSECISRQQIIQAAFADALRAGGSLDAILAKEASGGRTPLLLAVQRKLPEAVSALLRPLGAPPDIGDMASGWSPLMFAISNGNKPIAELLISHGASINFVSRPHGYTPLMAALVSGSEPMVEWLLSKGADPMTDTKVLRGTLVAHFGKESPALKRSLDRRRARIGC